MLKKYLFIIFCFASANSLLAQIMGVKHFKILEGGKQVKISTLFKSNQGYIYTGTSDGLYKFDGLKFYLVPFNNSVSNAAITAIFQDNTNQIWVGMQSGNIARLINGSLKLFTPEEGTPKKPITSFLQDKQNNIWFSTEGEGIYYYSNSHFYNIDTEDGLSENNVYKITLAENGEVIAGTDQGISICKILEGQKKIININSKNGLPDNYVKVIVAAGNNNYWIGMQDKGLCLFNIESRQFTTPSFLKEWKYGEINSLLYSHNNLWIATESEGVLKSSAIGESLTKFNIINEPALNINNLLQDNEGNIWLLANNNELIKTSGEQLKLLIPYTLHEFDKVRAILCDADNNIWRGTYRGIIRSSDNKEKKYTINELDDKTDVTALYHDIYDRTWIGTRGKGIFVLDEKTGNYRSITENKLLQNSSILSITGKENTVFVSSLEGAAAFNLIKNQSINNKYSYTNFTNISAIGSNYIYNIFKDSKDRIWFATFGKGLSVLENNNIKTYDETSGLKDKVVYCVTEDKKGNIWFSTHSAGIYKFDGKTFTQYSITNGLSDIDISAVKSDNNGNILIVYKKGIDILDPQTGQVSYINSNQGIKDINVQDLGAVTQDTSGGIVVSTLDGIVSYRPLPNTARHPQTILESVQLFFSAIDENASPNIFSHSQNVFTFSWTGLYYTNPEPVQYEYKLEGYINEWIITKDRTITFPKLPPGKYTFRVRSSINQIFDAPNEAIYQFVIRKPFWTTWWFIVLSVCTAVGLLYWYIKLRERSVKKVERLNQEKIQFQFETLRNQVNPHFLFNSFNTLISIIEDDPKMAVEYVEQLSDFFRNIVNYRDKDIITLKEEIELLQTYFFIQQKRFGQNLKLHIHLTEEEKQGTFIPPLTLQLLAENAIKHNAVSKETPLIIDIFIEDDKLYVRNNINPKFNKETGAGMGLQNITNRYKLLTKKEISIKNNNKIFVVSLPVVKQ